VRGPGRPRPGLPAVQKNAVKSVYNGHTVRYNESMTHRLEQHLANLYDEHANRGMSYAEYAFRYDRAVGSVPTLASFRINGGSREAYDRLVAAGV
jgi:hypothetical protein